jgi:hypothetical protein
MGYLYLLRVTGKEGFYQVEAQEMVLSSLKCSSESTELSEVLLEEEEEENRSVASRSRLN